jgi:hypothetical protein
VIPVWAWVLIWVVLVAALLAMLVFFAVRLFRQAMGALGALEDLGDQIAEFDAGAPLPAAPFRPAVFQDRRTLAAAIDLSRADRARRRALRRELSINRGKLLQHTPYKPEDRPPC